MKTYQELAARTLPGGPATTELEKLCNMLLGLMGEASEMQMAFYASEEKFKGEAGDFRWYFSGVHSCLGFVEFADLLSCGLPDSKAKPENLFSILFSEIGKLQELAKKRYFHQKQIEDYQFRYHLDNIFICWLALLEKHNLTQQEVEAANIEKLEKRYPNGFSVEDSATRRDVTA